jgi:hypothetical protein
MKVDTITVTIFNDSDDLLMDDQFEVILFPDSGNDIYPEGIELNDEILDKINQIRSICF